MKGLSLLPVLAAAAFLNGCATTRVIDSWKNPEFQGTLNFKKVVVMAIAKEEVTRRVAEDELVAEIGADKATASHTLIPHDDIQNLEKAKDELKKFGVDGLVTVRPIDVRKEVNYVPGTIADPYRSPWGYSAYSWGRAYEPGYLTTDTIVRLETNIYTMPDEKLIWSGASETFNPASIRTEARNLARALRTKLKKDNLLLP